MEIRDLAVDLAVTLGIVAHNVMRAVVMVLVALGATVQNEPTSRNFVLRCIVERETMLFDDQVRRMSEANQKEHWYSQWCGAPVSCQSAQSHGQYTIVLLRVLASVINSPILN